MRNRRRVAVGRFKKREGQTVGWPSVPLSPPSSSTREPRRRPNKRKRHLTSITAAVARV